MKLGTTVSDDSMSIIAPAYVWETGRWKYRHPRCGFVVLERRENLAAHVEHPQQAFHWVVVSIEKPDKD